MNRHDLDAVSLTAGVLFATVAVVSLLGRADIVDVQAKWLWPLVLIGLGLAGLLGALRPEHHDRAVEPAPGEPVTAADSDGPDPS